MKYVCECLFLLRYLDIALGPACFTTFGENVQFKKFALLDNRYLRCRLSTHQVGRIRLKICPRAFRVFATKPLVVIAGWDND